MIGSKTCTGTAVCLLLLHTVLGAPKSTSGQPLDAAMVLYSPDQGPKGSLSALSNSHIE